MTTVKPLEWSAEDNGEFIAMSPVGWYHIGYPCRSWNLTMPSGEVPSFGDDLEAAKAAAFTDYSARIMSAIEPAGVGVETEDALYRFLVEGDVIRINDEFMSDDGATWVAPSGWEVGMEYPSKLFKSARRLVRAALKGDEQ